MYVDSGVIGMLRLDSSKTFQTIAENNNEQIVGNYFNSKRGIGYTPPH